MTNDKGNFSMGKVGIEDRGIMRYMIVQGEIGECEEFIKKKYA